MVVKFINDRRIQSHFRIDSYIEDHEILGRQPDFVADKAYFHSDMTSPELLELYPSGGKKQLFIALLSGKVVAIVDCNGADICLTKTSPRLTDDQRALIASGLQMHANMHLDGS